MHTSVRSTRTEAVVLGFGISWSSWVHFLVFPLSRGGVLFSFLPCIHFATAVIYIPGGESGYFGRFGSSVLRAGLAYCASRFLQLVLYSLFPSIVGVVIIDLHS